MNKYNLLKEAIEIAKEYARGGGPMNIDTVLEIAYAKLKELNEDAKE